MSSIERRVTALARALGVAVEPAPAARVVRWLEEARTWNEKLDLTAARTEDALVEVLLADALMAADRSLVPEGARFADVGTGAGTPGLGLALLRDDLSALLVEPLQKRVAFLRTVVGMVGVASRVRVEGGRVEPTRPTLPAEVDLVVSRATFAPPLMLEVGLALAPAVLLFLVDDVPPLPAGARQVAEKTYRLPSSGAPRRIVRIER